MKRIILVLTFAAISIGAFAQQDTLRPQKGDAGFGLSITGIINNISISNANDPNGNYMAFGKYYISNDKALRVGLALDYLNNTSSFADSLNIASGNRALSEVDSTRSRFDFTIALGIEKHLGYNKRLDPYIGAEMIVTRMGGTDITIDSNITDVTGTEKNRTTIHNDGGFGFGVGGMVGFNFFLAKNLSLGAEFGYTFMYVSSGGEYSRSDVKTPVNGDQVSSFVNGKAESNSIKIGVAPTSGINLSFFF